MSKIEERLADYRSMRDSSRSVLMAEIEHARTTFSAKGLTSRYLGGVIEGGKDVYEVAKVHTVDNRGIIAILLGALAVWFGREPLLAAMAEDLGEETPEADGIAEEQDRTVQQSETDTSAVEPPSRDTNDK
ncbi:MAG: hypothetical protein ABJ205_07395 [Erythrobacter sp.]|uniref:hypothetical protein n=1 Tax=Erythrobacter sp. TaxID=1042 RepID=UPI0032658FA0